MTLQDIIRANKFVCCRCNEPVTSGQCEIAEDFQSAVVVFKHHGESWMEVIKGDMRVRSQRSIRTIGEQLEKIRPFNPEGIEASQSQVKAIVDNFDDFFRPQPSNVETEEERRTRQLAERIALAEQQRDERRRFEEQANRAGINGQFWNQNLGKPVAEDSDTARVGSIIVRTNQFRCALCNTAPIAIRSVVDMPSWEWKITARCHGREDTLSIRESDLARFVKVSDTTRTLFTVFGSDAAVLAAYDRGDLIANWNSPINNPEPAPPAPAPEPLHEAGRSFNFDL